LSAKKLTPSAYSKKVTVRKDGGMDLEKVNTATNPYFMMNHFPFLFLLLSDAKRLSSWGSLFLGKDIE
jgi:hypothetical protein